MTAFTSTQNGNWNDPDTWDVGGGDYPTLTTADDTASVGHTVTYNIDNSGTNRMGKITLTSAGILQHSTGASTYLHIRGDASHVVYGTGGEWHIATSGSHLSSSYTVTIEVDQATDNTGIFFSCVSDTDPKWYGAVKTVKGNTTSALTADTSSSFTMSSVPGDWAASDELLIQATGSTRLENEILTISSIAGTTVNFTGGGATSKCEFSHLSGALLLNLTRNITVKTTSSSTRTSRGIAGGNSTFDIQYVDFNGLSGGTYGSLNCGTQHAGARYVKWIGLVVRNNGSNGSYHAGSGGRFIKDCVLYKNAGDGIGSANLTGDDDFRNCYFVENGGEGLRVYNRGQILLQDCFTWSNGTDGFEFYGQYAHLINCYSFLNVGYGIDNQTGPATEAYNCYFGESEVGTQVNSNADVYTKRTSCKFNDCKFSSVDLLDAGDQAGINLESSNHQQTGSNLLIMNGESNGSIQDDASVYRTSAPSIKFDCVKSQKPLIYKIPVAASSGDTVTVSVYGKKSSSTGWLYDPYMRFIGCGIDSTSTFDTADTNWNLKTVSGTTSRDGIIILAIFVEDDANDFNIDDITVAIT